METVVRNDGEAPGPVTEAVPAASETGAWRRIFQEIAEGRHQALAELYDGLHRRLYGLALWRTGHRDDADDVVQEVFVRIARRRRELDRVRDPLAWVLTVTHRVAVDLTRRRSVRAAQPLEAADQLLAPGPDPARAVDAARISAHLHHLPAAQREVLYLRHFGDHSFAEIGAITGVPTFTAASRYRRGLAHLKRRMTEDAP